jgi:hypothetical protein
VHLPSYVRSIQGVLDENGQREIELAICRHPGAGAVIQGAGGVRKLRVALPGRGKSGGGRVVYFYRSTVGRVYLVLFYAKKVQGNLTSLQKHELRRLTAILRAES